jgi:hypothetical protein
MEFVICKRIGGAVVAWGRGDDTKEFASRAKAQGWDHSTYYCKMFNLSWDQVLTLPYVKDDFPITIEEILTTLRKCQYNFNPEYRDPFNHTVCSVCNMPLATSSIDGNIDESKHADGCMLHRLLTQLDQYELRKL